MNDTAASDAFPFLGSDSEIATAIRAFDWRGTGLGPLEHWPSYLRVVTSLMLRSAVPMTLQWGQQGWLLYNDAYRGIAGSRHPDLLGKTIADSWPEVAEFRKKVVDRVLDGNTISYCDEHLILVRNDVPEDVWLDIDYSPVVDDAGLPVGVLAIVKDITDRKRAEQLLAESEHRWRELVEHMDIKEIRHRNTRMLVAQLGNEAEFSGRHSGGMVMLAEILGKSVAQVSRFAAETPSTRIGDRIAREIEEAFGKEHGWMDHAQWQAHRNATSSRAT